ncbi:MAG: hypothetical protein HHAS10_11800 [Candidatus Altimarinota bacterium]
MTLEIFFAFLSSILVVGGNIPYYSDILRGRSYPHPITFGIWTILVGFNTYVIFLSGEFLALIPSLLMLVSNFVFIIFGIIHFKRIQINWFDWFCLILALFMISYWFFSKNITNTVIITITVDFVAYLPAFKKGWIAPWSETTISYFIPGITQVFTLLSIEKVTFENSLFWIYLFIANITFVLLVLSRRYYLKGWKSLFE